MTTIQTLIATAALALTAPAIAQPVLPEVDAALNPLVDQGEIVGVASIAWHEGELVHRSGHGVRNLETGEPMQPDTVVWAFSMTKPVTAVAMMMLYEEGLWSPDDPITDYLPELAAMPVFHGLDESGEPILIASASPPTMAQLMTHTAGFSYGFLPGWVDDRYREAGLFSARDADDFVARVAGLPLAFEPGSEWRYSIAMDLQGVIIERLTGQSLSDFMETRIFAPLAMEDTGFSVEPEDRDRLATLYRWTGERLEPVEGSPLGTNPDAVPGFASGGGGLFSTADDYLRFARLLLGRGELDGVRLISEASAGMIMTDQIGDEMAAGGFGIGFQQIRPGYQYGYNGVVITDPDAAGVALGEGSYLWDGAAGTWFWVDPAHGTAFVGMIQRMADSGLPPVQPLSQEAVADALYAE